MFSAQNVKLELHTKIQVAGSAGEITRDSGSFKIVTLSDRHVSVFFLTNCLSPAKLRPQPRGC